MSRPYGNNRGEYHHYDYPNMQAPNSQSGNPYSQSGNGGSNANNSRTELPLRRRLSSRSSDTESTQFGVYETPYQTISCSSRDGSCTPPNDRKSQSVNRNYAPLNSIHDVQNTGRNTASHEQGLINRRDPSQNSIYGSKNIDHNPSLREQNRPVNRGGPSQNSNYDSLNRDHNVVAREQGPRNRRDPSQNSIYGSKNIDHNPSLREQNRPVNRGGPSQNSIYGSKNIDHNPSFRERNRPVNRGVPSQNSIYESQNTNRNTATREQGPRNRRDHSQNSIYEPQNRNLNAATREQNQPWNLPYPTDNFAYPQPNIPSWKPNNYVDNLPDDPTHVPTRILRSIKGVRDFSKLNQLMYKYEINPEIASRFHVLADCEIVVLCDDSGSMVTPVEGSYGTRWDELKSIVSIVVEISVVMHSDGVDIYFLNRPPILSVTNFEQIRNEFSIAPTGLTPLVTALRQILSSKKNLPRGRKLLIFIATDGAPTNTTGREDIRTLESVLRNERPKETYVTFLACTDDANAVSYLNNWDKAIHDLDVVENYTAERAQILEKRGPQFPFSFGDYVAKALLGSVDPWFDTLDE